MHLRCTDHLEETCGDKRLLDPCLDTQFKWFQLENLLESISTGSKRIHYRRWPIFLWSFQLTTDDFPQKTWLGLDIGGANLKCATTTGLATSTYFPLWQSPEKLSQVIAREAQSFDHQSRIAVTMTGELADCFASKQEGVVSIIDAVQAALPQTEVIYYGTDGEFYKAAEAKRNWNIIAAANWHALAKLVATELAQAADLLVDCGSTTTDVIPILNRQVISTGRTDPERIKNFELVYTGVQRSPVNSVLPRFDWEGNLVLLAQELFATMDDVYLLLVLVPECNSTQTADGRPRQVEFAQRRLAKMLCADVDEIGDSTIISIAKQAMEAQVDRIKEAILIQLVKLRDRRGSSNTEAFRIAISGQGSFLIEEAIARCGIDLIAIDPKPIKLDMLLSPDVSRAAAAYAVAVLASQRNL